MSRRSSCTPRLTIVYAGFAFVVARCCGRISAADLLAGAQLSFYVQTPRTWCGPAAAAALERGVEQLALNLMYFVAARHVAGGRRWSVNRLATELGLPASRAQMAATLERAGLLIRHRLRRAGSGARHRAPRVYEILDIARNQGSGHVEPATCPPPGRPLLAGVEMRAASLRRAHATRPGR